MASNLIRSLFNRGRSIARNVSVLSSMHAKHVAGKQAEAARATQQQSQARARHVSSRVRGVKKVTRSVTSGTRANRAKQLRALRNNPRQRAILRRRVKFHTIP